ncbi:hypothetical protein B0T21DRAFT_347141 [Apiosordaria backusii]|uniref:Ubiquitin 3 binding protein But2 C-terminal domain-containing protein n=1 Tax=Apiosordaria backusii TaxID=314023 RepID=A0AA40EIB2_9PEZI|nr:hypothetical protein B0T21DRAFT_347141 [Apiosordaria backusii]
MQFSTLLITLSAAVGLTLAAPTAHSTCRRVQADATLLNVTNHPLLNVYQPQVISFSVPLKTVRRGPCALVADFPAGYSILDSSVQQGGPTLPINVIDVDGPAPGNSIGNIHFPSTVPDQKTKEAAKLTINSFRCREEMTFRFEVAGDGQVMFMTNGNYGLFMEFDC